VTQPNASTEQFVHLLHHGERIRHVQNVRLALRPTAIGVKVDGTAFVDETPADDVRFFTVTTRGEPLRVARRGARLADLVRRPRLTYEDLKPFDPDRPALPPEVAREAEISLKYAGYIDRQLRQVEEMKRLEGYPLPHDLDYLSIHGLRMEARQKLQEIRPTSLGQASRVSGVSPADVAVLMVYLKK
jgi:tRNA uridine 5-carboxymethylaminomethyl modification enzyme